jgi:general secretion pathway protein C
MKIMTSMWRKVHLTVGWLQRAPRWAAPVLAGLIAADVAHSAWKLHVLWSPSHAVSPAAPLASLPKSGPRTREVVSAHLFGAAPSARAATGSDGAPDTKLPLELSGIIAVRDPVAGYAILGERGKPTRMYRAGAPLTTGGGGRLYQVFADRVVLDFDGRLETLRLPRTTLPGFFQPLAPVEVADTAATSAPADPASASPQTQVSLGESAFGEVNAEPNNVDGHLAGMVLHPVKQTQRQYGLRDGDMLTAVDGVEITDADVLADTLKKAGQSLTLTVVRDGVTQTKTLPVGN